MHNKKLPIGISDFKDIITGPYYYVDKSLFIKEILDCGDKIVLIPRPRRFGKTLNMSMLKYFFDCCPITTTTTPPNTPPDNNPTHLFKSLAIHHAGQEYLHKMGQFPVIFLSFKNVKQESWKDCLTYIKTLLQEEYTKHDYLLDSPLLKSYEKQYVAKIIEAKGSQVNYEQSLQKLLIFLFRYYQKRAIILIDEYDAPVQAGFQSGYYEQIVTFMRNFLGSSLKDMDPYLEKAVLTGIMRIAKESIFSGFNNPGVYTLLVENFSHCFGFTQPEVNTMLNDFQVLHKYKEVQTWYNGYRFGEQVIFNPWSIINFLNSKTKEFMPYWVNTSDNQIVHTLLSKGGTELHKELEQLIRGETIEKVIDENIVFKDIPIRDDLLWSFLLMTGYLKQTAKRREDFSEKVFYTLSIPNREVRSIYTAIVDRYFSTKIENNVLEVMLKALIEGDVPLFSLKLKQVVLKIFSFHDFGNESEKVYHALVTGLLIWITNTHEIRSNRESGYGRYDIMIIPKNINQIGYVIEFKTVSALKSETIDAALNDALTQIETKQYATELQERGIKKIIHMAIAFSGKEVAVQVKE